MSPIGLLAKRSVDLFITISILIVASPVFAIITPLVRYKLGSPVFFRQLRPGLHGTPFNIYKFRTMTGERDKSGNLLPDAARLTRFGAWLRKTSIDELPQLFNVLKGDMSLVGPRPLLLKYLPLYTDEQKKRNNVRPGMVSLASVSGRNALSWDEKFALDTWYVENWSLLLDIKILLLTIATVIKCEGVSHAGSATMPEFKGDESQTKK